MIHTLASGRRITQLVLTERSRTESTIAVYLLKSWIGPPAAGSGNSSVIGARESERGSGGCAMVGRSGVPEASNDTDDAGTSGMPVSGCVG
jgi:hypothetical protein